ncbi:MAG: GNAT family N-acetyltransferase [Myxococcales bacterium]|nr:GNAT family N-acetyltransferase [Myxococcales bacterium]
MSIRCAEPRDIVAIARLQSRLWRSSYRGIVPQPVLDAFTPRAREAAWRRDGLDYPGGRGVTWVFEREGEGIAGFAAAGPPRATSELERELYALYVAGDHQRRGVGSALLAAAADGAATLLVWVLEDNPARTFYLRRGARRVGRRRIEVGGASLAEIAYAIG